MEFTAIRRLKLYIVPYRNLALPTYLVRVVLKSTTILLLYRLSSGSETRQDKAKAKAREGAQQCPSGAPAVLQRCYSGATAVPQCPVQATGKQVVRILSEEFLVRIGEDCGLIDRDPIHRNDNNNKQAFFIEAC